jgi:hypothetical protein
MYLRHNQTFNTLKEIFSCDRAVIGNTVYCVSDRPRSLVSEYLNTVIMVFSYSEQFLMRR